MATWIAVSSLPNHFKQAKNMRKGYKKAGNAGFFVLPFAEEGE
jgi:hypothetical protein